ncbi:MAG: hypothetical protein ACRD6X_15940 [Pyrinomonadaceae bacterium]
MVRIILGVVVGFVAWSVLWVGSEEVLKMASPDWYAPHQVALEKAMFNKTPFIDQANSSILILAIVRGVIFSIMAGFLASVIANGNRNASLILGILLLGVGILVQSFHWSYLPAWYNIIFVLLLLPMTILGGRMKTSA